MSFSLNRTIQSLERLMTVRHYRELEVWKLGMRLAHLAYDCTERSPSIERHVFLAQVRRAALSVPANIAEGQGRAPRETHHALRTTRYAPRVTHHALRTTRLGRNASWGLAAAPRV